jgi:hypothetical protein
VEYDGKDDVDMKSGDREWSCDQDIRIVGAKKKEMSLYMEERIERTEIVTHVLNPVAISFLPGFFIIA